MTIRDMEKKVGITSANIRFYEKEGLLTPKRNKDNNYRTYSEEDVELLRKIKILRMLGISVRDICLLIHSEMELSNVIQKRREELRCEAENLKEMDKLCKVILEEEMQFDTMDCVGLEKEVVTLSDRLDYIIHGDVTKELISKKKMNSIMMWMLLWAFLSNACITFLTAEWMCAGASGLTKMFWPVIVICIFSAFAVAWTAKPGVQIVVFQLVSLTWIPILLMFLKWITRSGEYVILRNGGIRIFVAFAFAVIILRILSETKMFQKLWNVYLLMLVFSLIAAKIISYSVNISYVLSTILITVFVLYMSTVWVQVNRGDGVINKYFVITTVTGILNFIVRMLNYHSIGMEKGYGRQDLWKEDK